MTSTGPQAPLAQQGELVAGRYRLESLVARGGVGAVWKATDLSTGSPIALKQLLPEASTNARLALLFQREYHTLALLDHPRVIDVYDYGVTARGPYYTMELLDGMDLGELSPIPYRKACHYLRDVASSLALLHTRRLLHRDLSPRNVRCTSDDRCKLLDFGTMATFGRSTEIVGTPPLVAPEALRGMPLDNRADIYSLGALAYRILTRRHAYRARQLEDLPELLRTPPPPPSSLVANIPEELDRLVLSMLNLDPLLRPQHVSEVIDRLTAIGDLPKADDVSEAARSYLLSARLVGRKRPMEQIKGHLRAAASGHGASMMFEGNPGVGKTRLLDEASLHAQLLGFLVVRTDARAHRGPYAVLTALSRSLHHAAPRDAEASARKVGPVLTRFLERSMAGAAVEAPLRIQIQDAMVQWLVNLSATRPILVIVDDLQRVDEPSAAFLLALARRIQKHALLLITTRRLAGRTDASALVPLLAAQARRVRLHRLKAKGTSVLVRSLFGDVPNVESVASYVHGISTGSPEQIMALCEYLVEQRIVRYVDGIWVLPPEIALPRLPESLSETLHARISVLGERARMIAEAASVRRAPLPLELLVAAVPELNREDLFAEVDTLVKAGIMVSSGDGYTFGQDALRECLRTSMSEERRQQCHARLATALLAKPGADLEERIEAGYHTLRGGQEVAGAQQLAQTAAELAMRGDTLDGALHALSAALEVLEREDARPMDIVRLRSTLVMSADRDICARLGSSTLKLLASYAGVPTMEKLPGMSGTGAGLALGLGAATGRRLLQKEERRGPRPQVALGLLFRAIFVLLPVRSSAMDIQGLRELAHYTKRLQRTPVIGQISSALVNGVLATAVGQYHTAERLLATAIKLLREEKTVTVLHTESVRGMLAASYIAQGLLRAQVRARSAETLDVLETLNDLTSDPRFAGMNQGIGRDGGLTTAEILRAAHQVRLAYHLGRGETELAAIQADQLPAEGLRAGLYWQFDNFRTLFELRAGRMTGDLSALRRGAEQLRQVVKGSEALAVEHRAAEAAIALSLGRLSEASEIIEALILQVPPGSHELWAAALQLRADVQWARGELSGAAQTLRDIVAAFSEMATTETVPGLIAEAELARVEAALGDVRQGMARMDQIFRRVADVDHPLLMTRLHSCAARVAIAAAEQVHCEAHVRHAQHWASLTRNTALLSQTHRLEAEYRRAFGVTETKRATYPDPETSKQRKAEDRIEALMADCVGDEDRARRALNIILETTAATAGYLYLVRSAESDLSCAAAVGLGEPQDQLELLLHERVMATSGDGEAEPLEDVDAPASAIELVLQEEDEATEAHQAFLLYRKRGRKRQVAGVVVLPRDGAPLKAVTQGFLDAVGACLRGGSTTAIRT